MKKQKGQAIVEFALVLPFFLFFVFAIMYTGMLFADYMTLSNVARSSAREAAIGADSISTIKTYYQNHTTLWTNLYQWRPANTNDFKIETSNDIPGAVKVTIRTTLNQSFPAVGFVSNVLPNQYTIEYYMHNEQAASS